MLCWPGRPSRPACPHTTGGGLATAPYPQGPGWGRTTAWQACWRQDSDRVTCRGSRLAGVTHDNWVSGNPGWWSFGGQRAGGLALLSCDLPPSTSLPLGAHSRWMAGNWTGEREAEARHPGCGLRPGGGLCDVLGCEGSRCLAGEEASPACPLTLPTLQWGPPPGWTGSAALPAQGGAAGGRPRRRLGTGVAGAATEAWVERRGRWSRMGQLG